jgi:hypothetical protein
MGAIHHFYSMNHQELQLLNQAFVVLVPKKEDPQSINDFRPISLTHSFSKIISKILANMLGPELHHLISINQTTFIKKRVIHGNFVFVQQVIKDLHKRKIPALFIKLDISKAFDTFCWPYLISIMDHLGFGLRWINWICSLWYSASSSFLLNGDPSQRILHCRGVRQGDPLSPMLFLLAMELLHRLFSRAQQMGMLDKLSGGCERFRASLYADDAAIFIKPNSKELVVTECILDLFAKASGLITNIGKAEFFPIRCEAMNLDFLAHHNRTLPSFPTTYLGLPLHFRKLTRAMFHSVIQKIGSRLPD